MSKSYRILFQATKSASDYSSHLRSPADMVTHIKGFASKMDPLMRFDASFLDQILQGSHEIMWDGDALALTSFTKLVPALINHQVNSNVHHLPLPSFSTFCYADAEDFFLSKWHDVVVTIPDPDDHGNMIISKRADVVADVDVNDMMIIPLTYRCVTPEDVKTRFNHRTELPHLDIDASMHESMIPYLYLGAHAIRTTGSLRVYCVGGSGCVEYEYYASMVADPKPQWYIYDVSRIVQRDGNTVNESCGVLATTGPYQVIKPA